MSTDQFSIAAPCLFSPEGPQGMVAIGGLGASTNDMAARGDHERNFYLWGGMGGAVMMGLGLALAQPDVPVVVITGTARC